MLRVEAIQLHFDSINRFNDWFDSMNQFIEAQILPQLKMKGTVFVLDVPYTAETSMNFVFIPLFVSQM